jgi:hypothetical protein
LGALATSAREQGKADELLTIQTDLTSDAATKESRLFARDIHCPARLHVRGNDLGNVEMAASLDLLHFHPDHLEMISSSVVEIRETAISTCPPFPPPTEDQPTLDMVGRPRP